MDKPKVGTRYRHTAEQGLAARARLADPAVGDDLHPEMAQLDLPPDTVVEVVAFDDDRDLVLVQWTDGNDTERITSLDEDDFTASFTREG